MFPILHLGRPQYFYWLAPYPNTMLLWPQWRSALVWDFWAILSYLHILDHFFLCRAAARPRHHARSGRDDGRRVHLRRFCTGLARLRAALAHSTKRFHKTLAALAVPLVVSVHSIVGLDFAASLMPGWQESIFPPYFVVGALYSGFAMVARSERPHPLGNAARGS